MAVSAAMCAVMAVAAPGFAAPPAPISSISTCSLEGWSVDADPSGLRVRAAPSATAKVLGHLPAYVAHDPVEGGDYGPGFDIDAARDGWLHISHSRDSWAPAGSERPTFGGAGWVHGSRVRMRVEGLLGRARPSAGSEVVVDTGSVPVSDVGTVSGVLDCAGKWARLAYRIETDRPIRGRREGVAWFDRVCGEQRTTCTR